MHNRLLILILLTSTLLVAPVGCKRRKRAAPPPEPVVTEPAPAVGIASDPCDSPDRSHKWIYYPDEPLYFCDRHRHHWIPDGVGGWAHIKEYDHGRPNYSAIILANQSEWEIWQNHAQHAADYPPGSRRR